VEAIDRERLIYGRLMSAGDLLGNPDLLRKEFGGYALSCWRADFHIGSRAKSDSGYRAW
jgi:hypothetical protein